MCCMWLAENTGRKKSPSGHHPTTLSGYISATRACNDNWKKNLLSSNISSTCRHNMVNFDPLAAEIVSGVSGTPATFNGERLPFRSGSSHYSHFLIENERENASFFSVSIFHAIFQSENGKLSRNIKPCLRYKVTGMWFCC